MACVCPRNLSRLSLFSTMISCFKTDPTPHGNTFQLILTAPHCSQKIVLPLIVQTGSTSFQLNILRFYFFVRNRYHVIKKCQSLSVTLALKLAPTPLSCLQTSSFIGSPHSLISHHATEEAGGAVARAGATASISWLCRVSRSNEREKVDNWNKYIKI